MKTRPFVAVRITMPTLIAVVAAVLLSMAVPAAADRTATGSLQGQIDAQLRLTPGGTQISENQVAWHNGAVILSLPASTTALITCPAGWMCFYDLPNWGGRMLQFRDCGYWQHFGNFGFRNQVSSWDNKTARWVEVNEDDPQPWIRLWNAPPRSRSSYVGAWADNRADALQILC